jgi:hypothetical protein
MDSLKKAQEAFSKVGGEYANSEFAAAALQKSNSMKRLIELQESKGEGETEEQQADKRFLTAEIQLMRLDEIDLAIGNYQAVIDSFPDTGIAPKAAYALAWIHQHKQTDSVRAIDLYRDVATRYPRSPQAKGAVIELGNLGAVEIRNTLIAYIDSALADTAAALAEERERRRRMQADSAAVDSMGARRGAGPSPDAAGAADSSTVRRPAVPPDSSVFRPRIIPRDEAAKSRAARRDSLLIPLGETGRDSTGVPDSSAVPDSTSMPPKSVEPDSTGISPAGAAPDTTGTYPQGAKPDSTGTPPTGIPPDSTGQSTGAGRLDGEPPRKEMNDNQKEHDRS